MAGLIETVTKALKGRPSQPDAQQAAAIKAEQDAAMAAEQQAKSADAQKAADMLPLIGVGGQEYHNGLFREEYHEDLADPLARVERMNELRVGDAVVSSHLRRLMVPISRIDLWSLQPAEGDVAEDAAEGESEPGEDEQPQQQAGKKSLRMAPEGQQDAPEKKLAAVAPEADEATQDDDSADGESGPEAEDDAAEGEAPEMPADQFRAALEANILGRGPRSYRMATTWQQWIREACTSLAFGFALFERELMAVDGPLGTWVLVKRLQWMHPRSIRRFLVNRDGELLGVEQWARQSAYGLPGSDEVLNPQKAADAIIGGRQLEDRGGWKLVVVPASRLVSIVRNREGANFEGLPDIRSVYMDARHAAFLRKAQRIDAAKRAIGIPMAEAETEASPETTSNVIAQLRRMRGGAAEMAYVYSPKGVKIGFMDMGANTIDVSPMMRATEERIAFGFGTEFTRRGAEGSGGSYSAGEIQAEYFNLQLNALAGWIADEVNRQLIEPLAELNGFCDSPPVLTVGDVAPPDVAKIADLKAKGALSWTDEDEQQLRRQIKWRPLTPQELEQRRAKKEQMAAIAEASVGMKPGESKAAGGESGNAKAADKKSEPPQPVAPMAPPKELAAPKMRRPLTTHEEKYGQIPRVQDAFDAFIMDVTQALRPLREAAVRDAIRRVSIDGHRGTVKGRLKDGPMKAAAKALAERMRELGRETAGAEIRQQVQALELAAPPEFDPFKPMAKKTRGLVGVTRVAQDLDNALETVIDLDVSRIMDGIIKSIEREILDGIAADMSEQEAIAAAQRNVLAASDRALEDAARNMASHAYNGGRSEVLEQSLEAGVPITHARRVEVMDENTCDTCMTLDGLVVEIESDAYWANMPPSKCDGGARCRGYYEFKVINPSTQEAP